MEENLICFLLDAYSRGVQWDGGVGEGVSIRFLLMSLQCFEMSLCEWNAVGLSVISSFSFQCLYDSK